jgi:hypothetical protein
MLQELLGCIEKLYRMTKLGIWDFDGNLFFVMKKDRPGQKTNAGIGWILLIIFCPGHLSFSYIKLIM